MSNIDWSQLITKKMKDNIVNADLLSLQATEEAVWQSYTLPLIADQLLALEDDDPTALPGTEREWRDYRIQVRAWKEGNVNFPDKSMRPTPPTGE